MMILALCFAIVFGVAILASFAGWIWLVVRGFNKSAGWGLAMLFVSPIAAIVAAVREWSEWKRPFLLYYGSFGVQIVVVVVSLLTVPLALPFGQIAENASVEMQPALRSVASTNAGREATETDTTAAHVESAPVPEPKTAVPTPRPRLPMEEIPAPDTGARTDPTGRPAVASMNRIGEPSTAIPDGYEEIAVSTASKRVGSRIRLVSRDGRIHKGTLTDVEGGRLHVTFEVSGGSIAMDFAAGEIRSLQVPR